MSAATTTLGVAISMGVCGYIESEGVKHWKPNMASLEGELGMQIMETIRNTPRPDFVRLGAEADALEARIAEARANGTY